MKKIIVLMAFVLSLTGCTGIKIRPYDKPIMGKKLIPKTIFRETTNRDASKTTSLVPSPSITPPTPAEEASIASSREIPDERSLLPLPEPEAEEYQVLIDDSYIKVSFIEIFEMDGLENTCFLRLLVENKTDQKVIIYLKDGYVNDFSVAMLSGIPMTIDPGRKSQNPFNFFGYKKSDISSLDFKIVIADESLNTIAETDVVKLY